MLLYADDFALIADTEEFLEVHVLSNRCEDSEMSINIDKTKVIHFRNRARLHTVFRLTRGNQIVDITPSCRYLGRVIDEHLNYGLTDKAVASAASLESDFEI